MRDIRKQTLALLALLGLAFGCAACGRDKAEAASMWLVKTEGKVAVSDGDGNDVDVLDRLGLFSGYEVGTRAESYGWIDLDETKFVKLDENSEAEVNKDGKVLELVVKEGSLFFNITEPLEDDEELTIRCSSMVTSIRGTSGWVFVEDKDHMVVYILDGKVKCTVTDLKDGSIVTEYVSAGEYAKLTDEKGASGIEKGEFDERDVPDFVRDENPAMPAAGGGDGSDPQAGSDISSDSAALHSDESAVSGESSISDGSADLDGSSGPDGQAASDAPVEAESSIVEATAPEVITWTADDLSFTLDSGVLTVSGSGPMEKSYMHFRRYSDGRYSDGIRSVVIEDGVTAIGDKTFLGWSGMTDITIADSVTQIGSGAFSGCFSLTGVTIPDSVTRIDDIVFQDCTSLQSIVIPDSVTRIGNNVFEGCSSLTEITLPSTMTVLHGVLSDCTGIQSITLPDQVAEISKNAFSGCTNLQTITIPESVFYIGPAAFSDCPSLTDIYYGGSERQWGAAITTDEGNRFDSTTEDVAVHYAK